MSATGNDTALGPEVEDFEYLLSHTTVMIAFMDNQGRYIFANERYCAFNNIPRDQLVGASVFDVLDPALLQRIGPKISAALAGQMQTFEVSLADSDGSTRWYEATYAPYLHPNKTISGFFAIIQDINDRKQSEASQARFQTAVDQGQEGFALHDAEGNFLYLNPAQAKMYGYEPAEVIGKSWTLFYGEEQAREIREQLFPQLEADRRWSGQLRGLHRNGGEFDVEVSLSMLTDDAGNAAGLVCNCRDITARKLEEAKLLQLQKMDSLGQLTGGIAHDFNNLLAVIIGNLDLLGTLSPLHPEFAQCVKTAVRAANQGRSLTQRLLAFSRQQTLNPSLINLNALVLSMQDMLSRSLGEQIEVRTELTPDLWPCEVDSSQLEGVILNLALNARDAMPNGGTLLIRTRNCAAPDGPADDRTGDGIVLSIQDTGEGIPPDLQDRIFEPFFTTKPPEKGSGLGLSMVHGFITQTGGQVAVDSRLGEGTKICLRLPRATGAELPPPSPEPEAPPTLEGRERVLIVEDNNDARKLFSTMLTELGCDVVQARNGPQALDIIAREPRFDMLLCDVVLSGGISGPQLVARIRETGPDLPVLFMSGYTGGDVEIDGPLILKPFTMAQLSAEVRKLLNG